jgi:hypothetical protein
VYVSAVTDSLRRPKSDLEPLKNAGRIKARKESTTGGPYRHLTLEELVG